MSDPTNGQTTLVADLNPGGTATTPYSSFPRELTVVDDKLYFSADDGISGRELWVYDPETGAPPERVYDIATGPDSSGPSQISALAITTPLLASVFEDGPPAEIDLSPFGSGVDSDDDGTTLNYAVISGPSAGSASIAGTALTFDPGPDFQDLSEGETRSVTVQVQAVDSHGATSNIIDVPVTVIGINDIPMGSPTAILDNGTEDVPYTVAAADLLAGFSDVENDTLHVANLAASNGTVTDNGDGSYTITPTADLNGIVTLTYDVTDGNGGILSGQTQSYTLNPVNDAPTAADDTYATDENVALSVAATGVLGNDYHGDGDLLTVSEVNGQAVDIGNEITLASGALLTLNADGSFDYNPNNQFETLAVGETATDGFSYTVSDSKWWHRHLND